MLKGLFYSEFHNTAGPVLVFQAPDEYACDPRLLLIVTARILSAKLVTNDRMCMR